MKLSKRELGLYICIIIFTILSVLLTNSITQKDKKNQESDYIYAKAQVKKIYYDDTDVKDKGNEENYLRKQELDIKILNGEHKGELYKIRNTIETIDVYHIIVSEDDKVLVNMTENENGEVISVQIYERVRENQTYLLVIIFIFSLILIGGLKGFKSVITLIFTGIMIIKVMLPLILHGYNPIILFIILISSF